MLVIGDSCKPQSTEEVLEHSCDAKDIFCHDEKKNNKVEHCIIPEIHRCLHLIQ